MASRKQNEKRFENWIELSDGGRRYWYDRDGTVFGFQRMIKFVDSNEVTMLVLQEVYDDNGNLIERHQKYPDDLGHENLRSE